MWTLQVAIIINGILLHKALKWLCVVKRNEEKNVVCHCEKTSACDADFSPGTLQCTYNTASRYLTNANPLRAN